MIEERCRKGAASQERSGKLALKTVLELSRTLSCDGFVHRSEYDWRRGPSILSFSSDALLVPKPHKVDHQLFNDPFPRGRRRLVPVTSLPTRVALRLAYCGTLPPDTVRHLRFAKKAFQQKCSAKESASGTSRSAE